MLFERREQIAGVARPRQRQKMLHRVGVHHADLAARIACQQPDRTGVEEFEQLLFARPFGHDGS
jgi:hypothetical protein